MVIFLKVIYNRYFQIALAVALILLSLALYSTAVRRDQIEKDRTANADAIFAADNRDDKADAAADNQAVKDASRILAEEKEKNNALKGEDTAPSGVALAAACARLRNTPAARSPEFSARCRP